MVETVSFSEARDSCERMLSGRARFRVVLLVGLLN